MTRPHRRAAPPADHRTMHEAVWTAARARALLDDPARRAGEDPLALWRRVGLARGMRVADVGAGSGFYTFPAGRLVGPTGRVYAIDVARELVALLRRRARARGRTNVRPVLARPGRIPLPDGSADRVLLANVLHGIPPATVREAARLLAAGGQLVVVDWQKRATPRGPPVGHRLSRAAARRALAAHGFTTVRQWAPGPSHYALLCERSTPSADPRSSP
ncbi:MAG: class I SAM-dependent methyltransferase [Thermoplasmata archaeon]